MVANAALATNYPLAEAPSPSHGATVRGAHARTGQDAPALRVIACPGGAGRLPQHARALPAAALPAASREAAARPKDTCRPDFPSPAHAARTALCLQGTAFGLTARERTFATGAGILFAAAALATILL